MDYGKCVCVYICVVYMSKTLKVSEVGIQPSPYGL